MIKSYQFIESKGVKIFYTKNVPDSSKAIVIISHGYAEYSGFYFELIDYLASHGFASYALDHRGHGHSEEERGHLERFEHFIDDMDAFVEYVQSLHSTLPLFMFGHSMGGLIAFNYGILHGEKVQGQVFSGAALGRPEGAKIIPNWAFKLAKKYFNRYKIYPVLKNRGTRNAKIDKCSVRDPYILKCATAGFFSEFIYRGIHFAQVNACRYNLPCLFLHGTADKIIPYKYSCEIHKRVLSQSKELKLYEGLYHELIQEPEREQVLRDIVNWLEKEYSKNE